jgi:hypothetical protein
VSPFVSSPLQPLTSLSCPSLAFPVLSFPLLSYPFLSTFSVVIREGRRRFSEWARQKNWPRLGRNRCVNRLTLCVGEVNGQPTPLLGRSGRSPATSPPAGGRGHQPRPRQPQMGRSPSRDYTPRRYLVSRSTPTTRAGDHGVTPPGTETRGAPCARQRAVTCGERVCNIFNGLRRQEYTGFGGSDRADANFLRWRVVEGGGGEFYSLHLGLMACVGVSFC